MPSDVTLQLNDPSAWTKRLTLNQSKPAGTAYDGIMLSNYSNRAATSAAIPTFGLDATISFSSGYQVYVAAFDSDLNYLGYNESGSSRGWKNPPYTFSSASAEYICIAVKSLPEAEFTDAMFEDMSMSVTLAGGGGSMTDAYSREEAYELNEIAGWEEFAYGPTANPTTAKFRNAGSGNGRRIWGLSEDGLPMGATGYMSIDTSAETCTNSDNTISQDSVPLVVGEVYTIGAFVRGKGYFTCGPTQDGYYRARSEHVDHPNWRFYGGVFTAKSTSQNMYWRNETIATSEYAGKLDISAPILVRGGVASVILATDTKTLAVTVDVQKVETYYYQTASTASAPTKPTTATPSGWQTTEFAFDASKAVWTCQKTTLSDGTFRWGEVSKWSAYEGAVVSKNAADAAQSTANSANAREQRIYRSAASGTTSMAATETWVASTADAQNAWTAKRPSYDRSYPVLFTATQRQTVAQQAAGSTCSCTTPYVDESAAVAGNYITKVGTGGDAWIHSEGHGPDSSGNATASTYGWRIGSVFELVRAGLSYFKMWVDNNVAKVRVGLESAGHSVFSPDGMEVFDYDSTLSTPAAVNVAKFGRDGAQIGLTDESHLTLDYHSMQMADKEGDTYFHVSDLRNTGGVAQVFEHITNNIGYNSSTSAVLITPSNLVAEPLYTTDYPMTATVTDVTVTGVQYIEGQPTYIYIYVDQQPPTDKTVDLTYWTDSDTVKAYTLGLREHDSFIGPMSIAEGTRTTAKGIRSHAEGYRTAAYGDSSHAEGYLAQARNNMAHAEGSMTTASGLNSHAEGEGTWATGKDSHSEGYTTFATGNYSHTEGHGGGLSENASGNYSHTEGYATKASGAAAHAQNYGTRASSAGQTALGKYNVEDIDDAYAVIVGNGTDDANRSNAVTIAWDGNYMAQAMAGIIQMFAGATPPTGWLVCDGSAVSRTTYATLFAAIGTTWGAGDGSTTFNLPDLRGRAPIGAGTGSGLTARTLAGTGGSEKLQSHNHSLTGGITSSGTCNITSSGGHTHTITTKTANIRASGNLGMAWSGGSGTSTSFDSIASNTGTHTHTVPNHTHTHNLAVSNKGDGNAENMQPFAVVNFIICTGKTS